MKSTIIKSTLTLIIAFAIAVGVQATKPSFQVDWYGYVKLDAAYDQNLTSHGNFVMWVEPEAIVDNDEQFNMTHKQSRFGFNAQGKGYQDVDVTGHVEVDLYGGGLENNALLLLRHAYFTVQSREFKLVAGQTYDIVSPLVPPTLNYSVLWSCGNIGYRRPQISLWYMAQPNDQTSVALAAGFFRTIGSDLTPTFSLQLGETKDGMDDGTDAGIPSFQGLLDVNYELNSGARVRAGISGLWGQLKAETNFNNSEKYESVAAVGHLHIDFTPDVGLAGEGYTGTNLANYYGGIDNPSTIEGVATTGGWCALWAKLTPNFKFTVGAGMDDPKDEDLAPGSRSNNMCYFGNVNFYIVPQVTLGFELSQWETEYNGADKAKNFRAQTSFALEF
jgi:hypothetical protein